MDVKGSRVYEPWLDDMRLVLILRARTSGIVVQILGHLLQVWIRGEMRVSSVLYSIRLQVNPG